MQIRISGILGVSSALLMSWGLTACGPKPPIHIGFIGGLTDRNSDNGQAGLNGVILAVEQFNREGGVDGRMVELITKDDAQTKDVAQLSAKELVDAKVEAVIGPFTSSMAEVIVPVTGRAGIFQVSPTITSMAFYGKDDNLFRINRTTHDNAKDYAQVLIKLGQKKVAVAYDMRNKNFTLSWLEQFRREMLENGGGVVAEVPYESSAETDFARVVAAMIKTRPEGLLFISGGLDVARLAQQARMQSPGLPIAASEWAATEQLIELGGNMVEGLLIAQNFDRDDNSERFKTFTDAYYKRFQRSPGYSSVSAYDAATVVLTTLKNRKPDEPLKAVALRTPGFEGLQQKIVFDANGDTQRKVFFTKISGGRYLKIPDEFQPGS